MEGTSANLSQTYLDKLGLRFDELNRVRVLDEETERHASQLTKTCDNFLQSTSEFGAIADSFIVIFDQLSKAVEQQKLAAIGARNLLQTYAKQRESEMQQLGSLIREKQSELERLESQLQSILKIESQQQELLEQIVLHK